MIGNTSFIWNGGIAVERLVLLYIKLSGESREVWKALQSSIKQLQSKES